MMLTKYIVNNTSMYSNHLIWVLLSFPYICMWQYTPTLAYIGGRNNGPINGTGHPTGQHRNA